MNVNLVFDLYADVIDVPECVAEKLNKYQRKCDKWLGSNEHNFWIKDNKGRKVLNMVSDAFIYFLNSTVLNDSDDKAYVVKKNVESIDKSLPTIFY